MAEYDLVHNEEEKSTETSVTVPSLLGFINRISHAVRNAMSQLIRSFELKENQDRKKKIAEEKKKMKKH